MQYHFPSFLPSNYDANDEVTFPRGESRLLLACLSLFMGRPLHKLTGWRTLSDRLRYYH